MSHDRLLAAAQRVLDGDDSREAAEDLERVLLDDFPDDERVGELLDVLARPAAVPEQVRTVIRETLAQLT